MRSGKALAAMFILLGAISTANANTGPGRFAHSEELSIQGGIPVLTVHIEPRFEQIQAEWMSSLDSIDVTAHAASQARAVTPLATGETKVASRTMKTVTFQIPLEVKEDGFHAIGVSLDASSGNDFRSLGQFPIFIKRNEGAVELISQNTWSEAHSKKEGPCKNAVCFRNPYGYPENTGAEE